MKKVLFLPILFFMLSANVNAVIIPGLVPTDGDVDAVDLSGLLDFPDPNPQFAIVAPNTDPNTAMKYLVNPVEVTPGIVSLPSEQVSFTPHVAGGYDINLSGITLPTNIFQIAWLSPVDSDWHLADMVVQKGADSYYMEFNDTLNGPRSTTNPSAALLVSDIHPVVSAVPVPASLWLFGSGLLGLCGIARR